MTKSSDSFPCFQMTKSPDSFLGLLHSLDGIINNQWEFRNTRDLMSFSHGECRQGCCRNCRYCCVSTLSDIDLSEPSSPSFIWIEHTTTSTHVTQRRYCCVSTLSN